MPASGHDQHAECMLKAGWVMCLVQLGRGSASTGKTQRRRTPVCWISIAQGLLLRRYVVHPGAHLLQRAHESRHRR